MKKQIPFLFCLAIFSCNNISSQNTVCLDIVANPNPSDPALSEFTKYIDVFGVGIYGEAGISDAKVKHVAAIMAEWLDNDEDGIVDNQAVLEELVNRDALMPIFTEEGSPAENALFDNYNGDGIAAVMYDFEIVMSRPLVDEFDATIEENLHLISSIGFANAYPMAFGEGENDNSDLTLAMDAARGGHFVDIPNNYPPEAWYHYDDNTCEYNCMATEYFYWGLTSMLDIQDYGNRCNQIDNEWEPCTAAQFESTDVLLHTLFSNTTYKMPTVAPDGNYCPTPSATKDHNTMGFSINISPNPALHFVNIECSSNEEKNLKMYNTSGLLMKEKTFRDTATSIDVSELSDGVYFISVNEQMVKKIVVSGEM